MADGKITLDGREIPFEKGDSIIKAAKRAGIEIPHYCWHPGLSAPANCRMCLVEVEPPAGRPKMMLDVLRLDPDSADDGAYAIVKKPKLFPACQIGCTDGMVVLSETSETVIETRKSVQELLLLNHPVDCPICDQAGECDLQDYWLAHQRSGKRMLLEPVHKPKAQPFGETIVYDAERCILCTRCIRTCEELVGDPVLSLRERGNLAEVVLSHDRQLDHAYTLMTEHVCPVGALTSKDFRFKARVWFLRSGRTVCQGCATGCNAYLDFDPRDNTPYRYRPRDNEEVNKYWMCDEGMLSYTEAYEDRLLNALVGGDDAELSDALSAAKKQLQRHSEDPKRIGIVLSAEHPDEDNFALALIAKRYLEAEQFFVSGRAEGEGDDILRDADKNPNRKGVQQVAAWLGLEEPKSMADLLAALKDDKLDYVISLGSRIDIPESEAKSELSRLKGFVAFCSHEGPLSKAAHIALPASSWAEMVGTYVNRQGIAQRTDAVLHPRGDAHPAWQLAVSLGRALGYDIDWQRRADLERAMLEHAAPKDKAASADDAAPAADDEANAGEVEA